jgi:hypothetical protein
LLASLEMNDLISADPNALYEFLAPLGEVRSVYSVDASLLSPDVIMLHPNAFKDLLEEHSHYKKDQAVNLVAR